MGPKRWGLEELASTWEVLNNKRDQRDQEVSRWGEEETSWLDPPRKGKDGEKTGALEARWRVPAFLLLNYAQDKSWEHNLSRLLPTQGLHDLPSLSILQWHLEPRAPPDEVQITLHFCLQKRGWWV